VPLKFGGQVGGSMALWLQYLSCESFIFWCWIWHFQFWLLVWTTIIKCNWYATLISLKCSWNLLLVRWMIDKCCEQWFWLDSDSFRSSFLRIMVQAVYWCTVQKKPSRISRSFSFFWKYPSSIRQCFLLKFLVEGTSNIWLWSVWNNGMWLVWRWALHE
jgi:hypothetical protein